MRVNTLKSQSFWLLHLISGDNQGVNCTFCQIEGYDVDLAEPVLCSKDHVHCTGTSVYIWSYLLLDIVYLLEALLQYWYQSARTEYVYVCIGCKEG